jgi:tryptophan-rich sensory protein
VSLAIAVLACLAVGAAGALLTRPQLGSWYRRLDKPRWNPPDSVFAPVWTTLYVMMAVAAWLVWRGGATWRLVPFAVQLALNLGWSGLFFALRRPGLAAVEIVFLWLSIAITIVAFAPVSMAAALLLLPYLAWVTFAGALNVRIWSLNR